MDKRPELAEILNKRLSDSKASAGYFTKFLMYPGWTPEAYEIFQSRVELDKRESDLFAATLESVPKLPNDAVDALLNFYRTPA
jgi:hypothetical protein